MKALTYGGPGVRTWETVPDPAVQEPTDVVVEIDSSTICGTDLHILKGDVPTVEPGRILGHEAVGTVVEAGAAVTTVAEGDRVLVSCITACGRCCFCREGHYGLCIGGGGWILGHLIDGLQAEYARVPFADTSVYKVPEELTDEQVLFLADILPTALRGRRPQRPRPARRHGRDRRRRPDRPRGDHDRQALHARAQIIAIDLADARLAQALDFGADVTINNGTEDAVDARAGADRRPRRRRRHRGGRRPGDVRALHRADPPRRAGRERRRPRTRRPRSTSRSCGSGTSRSRPASWTRSRPRSS